MTPSSPVPPPRLRFGGPASGGDDGAETLPPQSVELVRQPAEGWLVGRVDSCDISLAHAKVSKQHARLRRDGGRWFLRDLDSTNGTFVDGQRTRGEVELPESAALRFGVVPAALDLARERPRPARPRRAPGRPIRRRSPVPALGVMMLLLAGVGAVATHRWWLPGGERDELARGGDGATAGDPLRTSGATDGSSTGPPEGSPTAGAAAGDDSFPADGGSPAETPVGRGARELPVNPDGEGRGDAGERFDGKHGGARAPAGAAPRDRPSGSRGGPPPREPGESSRTPRRGPDRRQPPAGSAADLPPSPPAGAGGPPATTDAPTLARWLERHGDHPAAAEVRQRLKAGPVFVLRLSGTFPEGGDELLRAAVPLFCTPRERRVVERLGLGVRFVECGLRLRFRRDYRKGLGRRVGGRRLPPHPLAIELEVSPWRDGARAKPVARIEAKSPSLRDENLPVAGLTPREVWRRTLESLRPRLEAALAELARGR